jgi:hypothetical protein
MKNETGSLCLLSVLRQRIENVFSRVVLKYLVLHVMFFVLACLPIDDFSTRAGSGTRKARWR